MKYDLLKKLYLTNVHLLFLAGTLSFLVKWWGYIYSWIGQHITGFDESWLGVRTYPANYVLLGASVKPYQNAIPIFFYFLFFSFDQAFFGRPSVYCMWQVFGSCLAVANWNCITYSAMAKPHWRMVLIGPCYLKIGYNNNLATSARLQIIFFSHLPGECSFAQNLYFHL